jgi:hypothetical protein
MLMFCFALLFLCSELDAMMKRLDTRNQDAGALERYCFIKLFSNFAIVLDNFFFHRLPMFFFIYRAISRICLKALKIMKTICG